MKKQQQKLQIGPQNLGELNHLQMIAFYLNGILCWFYA